MRSFLDKLFRPTSRESRTWTETVHIEEPSTLVTRYVNLMLVELFKADSQTKILYRNVELPPITVESETYDSPRIDEIVKRLKEMCNVNDSNKSISAEGTIPCVYEGAAFNVKCHFDDNAEACCWVRAEKSDEKINCLSPDNIENDSCEKDGHRVIRYGSPEYRAFMKSKTRIPWRERIKRSLTWGIICTGLVLTALIVNHLIFGQTQWPILKMIGLALLAGAFIFVLMLFVYALEDLLG